MFFEKFKIFGIKFSAIGILLQLSRDIKNRGEIVRFILSKSSKHIEKLISHKSLRNNIPSKVTKFSSIFLSLAISLKSSIKDFILSTNVLFILKDLFKISSISFLSKSFCLNNSDSLL